MKLNNKKILILGGTGLIGEELVRRFAPSCDITIVSLGAQADKDSFSQLQKDFPRLKHLTGNVFLPTEYKEKTFNELLESDHFLEDYLKLLYLEPNYQKFYLYDVIRQTEPDVLIDSINSATVLSYTKNVSQIRDYLNGKVVKLETLLATLSMPRLLTYFDCLYRSIREVGTVSSFLKIGTTGTGGMGFNIPYTHGEEKPSFQLLEKAAVSGAFTNLLFLLSQTFGMPEIKEVKPAALVGYKKVGFDKILLGRNSSQSLKVYDFNQVNKIDLTKLKKLNFDDFGANGVSEDFRAVFVDTGENGQFSLEEFRTISNERQMGFITKEEIADVVAQELSGENSGHNMIKEFANSVLGPTANGQQIKEKVIEEMEQLGKENNSQSLAFEVLGPPRLSKLIFEAYLVQKNPNLDFKDGLDEVDLSMIVSTGIPVLLPNNTLIFGRKPKIPSYDNEVTANSIDDWANQGWVDLREQNLEHWKGRIKQLKDQNSNLEIGDIVAWIFEHEDKGFRKQKNP